MASQDSTSAQPSVDYDIVTGWLMPLIWARLVTFFLVPMGITNQRHFKFCLLYTSPSPRDRG
eukprot:1921089-Amphidinium_carterae.1